MQDTVAPAPPSVVPADEEQRLAAVRRYAILDTPPDGAFDRITALAARLLGAPIATISIVDRDRIWFKSKVGLDAEEIGRDPGLCASAILQDDPWLVTDALDDPRTLENPLVRGGLGLRFYLGVPLVTCDGYNLGTLNVIDREPRHSVPPDQVATLRELAGVVVDELELRLAALREERRLDRVRLAFVATAAHELRTLGAAVERAAAALRNRDVDDDVRDLVLSEVEERTARLEETVEHAAAELGSDAARVRILRERVEAVSIARRAVEAAHVKAPPRVTVELGPAPAAPLRIDDGRAVGEILDHLLDNAVRYSPEGGRVEVAVDATPDVVRFSVRDHGEGIAAEERERIFEKFYRADSASSRAAPGAGLGLYVARELARELEGRITVAPAPGGGSVFALELPVG